MSKRTFQPKNRRRARTHGFRAPHVDPRRPRHPGRPPRQGPRRALGLTGRSPVASSSAPGPRAPVLRRRPGPVAGAGVFVVGCLVAVRPGAVWAARRAPPEARPGHLRGRAPRGRRVRSGGLVVHGLLRTAGGSGRRRPGAGGPRVAFVAPRTCGPAVRRNRTRRRVQEQVRARSRARALPADVDLWSSEATEAGGRRLPARPSSRPGSPRRCDGLGVAAWPAGAASTEDAGGGAGRAPAGAAPAAAGAPRGGRPAAAGLPAHACRRCSVPCVGSRPPARRTL